MTPGATVRSLDETLAAQVGRRPDLADASCGRADEPPAATAEPADDLLALAMAAGLDVPRLARALGLGRAPLVDLVQGRVALPAPVALLAALADALGTVVTTVEAATRAAQARTCDVDGAVAPSAPRRSFADVLRDDPSTPAEVKARWLTLFEED